MAISDAQVKITYGELQGLQDKIRELEKENSELKIETAEAKLGPDGNLARQYREAFLNAVKIGRFAVGSLDPLIVRGWPFAELKRMANDLATLPGIDEDQRETAGDMKSFAHECEKWEGYRELGIEKEMLEGGGQPFTPEDIQAAKAAKSAESTASDPT